MKKVLFYRDYRGFTGGHLKVWDYFNHVNLSNHYSPGIFFSGKSVWENNPWSSFRNKIEQFWHPELVDILFLAGVDWKAIPDDWSENYPHIPIINLIQGVRHADPANPHYAYLSRPAIRSCVSKEVEEAISNTGKVEGPVFTIDNGLQFELFPEVRKYRERRYDIGIFALKQPKLGQLLYNRLQRPNLNIKLLVQRIARPDYLKLLNDTKIACMLPLNTEGFYLPALEAMRLGAVVICPDCVGNRSFCIDGINCLMPGYDIESLTTTVQSALEFREMNRQKITSNAHQTTLEHDILKERESFYTILSSVDELWREIVV